MKCPNCGSEDITFPRWQLHPAFFCCNCRWFFTDWQQMRIEELEKQLSEQSETVQRDWLSPVETAALKQRLEEAEEIVWVASWEIRSDLDGGTCPTEEAATALAYMKKWNGK